MIISASRRTDIPTYYSDWFFNRLKEGYVLVRNPISYHKVSKISLSPEVVDGIVFWTKNPIPMMNRIDELNEYNYYFQFTVNAYSKDVEPNIPMKRDYIVPAFQELSKRIGKERVVWRYDPIFLNSKYTVDYHIRYFRRLAELFADYTEKCTVSIVDMYRNTEKNIQPLSVDRGSENSCVDLLVKLSEIAKEYGLYIDTCAEQVDLTHLGIKRASCIDKERFERIGNYKLIVDKDRNQRPECCCIESIDIGTYNTCKNGCLYCYANFDKQSAENHYRNHDPNSPIIFGEITEDDIVKERAVKSLVDNQIDMFRVEI